MKLGKIIVLAGACLFAGGTYPGAAPILDGGSQASARDSEAIAQYRVAEHDAYQLDSVAQWIDSLAEVRRVELRKFDSMAHDQHLRAATVRAAARVWVMRALRLGPGDTLRPDGTIHRHEGTQRQ